MNEKTPIIASQEEAFNYVDTTLRAELDNKLTAIGFEKVGSAQIIRETSTEDGRKAWAYELEGMLVSLDARTCWLLDTGETVETTMNDDERTIEDAYRKKYSESTKDSIADIDELIAHARQLEKDGHLVDTESLAEKQADAPGVHGPFFASNLNKAAKTRAETLVRNIDPQYTGSFKINEISEVGYHAWQDVRGGSSIIVGNDGGILFFNSSISPEDGIQAYKDGKRSPEGQFNSVN
ncbi:MAG: hypothetical protein ABIR46_04590 [Candidatus Saccharimonadales bacterium]